ncbi:MAG: glycosyltransferase family 9 protein [Candidatus Omnitrophota bacterium]
MILRKISRKIKWKPLVRLRKAAQQAVYFIVGAAGSFTFSLLRALRLLPAVKVYKGEAIKKILVMRPDRIGDLILATPVFENLRRHFPKARIAVLIAKGNKDLIEGNPSIDQILVSPVPLRYLEAEKFDLAIVLYSAFWTARLAFRAGIPFRAGYDFHGCGFLLTHKIPYEQKAAALHEVDRNLNLLELIGITPQIKELRISVSPEAQKKISHWLLSRGLSENSHLAIVHPGAYEEYIRWRPEGFAKVADCLIADYKMQVVLLAGPQEYDLVRKVAALMHNQPVLATGLTLGQTVALIKRAELFIGNSTGPMHIAAALKIPVVAIFGSRHPMDDFHKWGPYGTKSFVVRRDVACKSCEPSECRHLRCMKEIEPAQVLEAVRAVRL